MTQEFNRAICDLDRGPKGFFEAQLHINQEIRMNPTVSPETIVSQVNSIESQPRHAHQYVRLIREQGSHIDVVPLNYGIFSQYSDLPPTQSRQKYYFGMQPVYPSYLNCPTFSGHPNRNFNDHANSAYSNYAYNPAYPVNAGCHFYSAQQSSCNPYSYPCENSSALYGQKVVAASSLTGLAIGSIIAAAASLRHRHQSW